MSNVVTEITPQIRIGDHQPLVVICGPCVIESEELCLRIAERALAICAKHSIHYVFKGSFDKANRTSIHSYRGPGIERGLAVLDTVRKQFGIPVLTDVHETSQVAAVADVVDILQIPAFLCRQTDLLVAAAESGRTINIKKGQFLSPHDMRHAVTKIKEAGNPRLMVTERGTTFGYNNLVVDMRSLPIMRSLGVPVVFDATHSVQLPGGQGNASGGQREFVRPLARAAAAVGIDGIFLETHPDPDAALSDGANSIPLEELEAVIREIHALHELTRQHPTD